MPNITAGPYILLIPPSPDWPHRIASLVGRESESVTIYSERTLSAADFDADLSRFVQITGLPVVTP